MNDETLRRRLGRISGDEPSAEFVDGLRRCLDQNPTWSGAGGSGTGGPGTAGSGTGPVTVLELDDQPQPGDEPRFEPDRGLGRRPRILALVAAAAVLLVGLPLWLQVISGDAGELETATTTEARQVGEAWLQSIVDADRQTFVALHGDELETDDTLMGFSEDVGLLTPTRISELYYDGFDALQAALAIDQDVIRPNGCQDIDGGVVRCWFTATVIGSVAYTYTLAAELVVEDRLITSIDFSTTTDPRDFRSLSQQFLEDEGTDEDRSCLTLGFNTVGCGEHESDFMTRYAAYYEAAQNPPDS